MDGEDKKIIEILYRIEDNQRRLESKIDKIDLEHDTTRERQIKLESRIEYHEKDFMRLIDKQEKDKKNIYDNMDEKIKKSVNESLMRMKLWVYAGGGTIIMFLIGIYGKLEE